MGHDAHSNLSHLGAHLIVQTASLKVSNTSHISDLKDKSSPLLALSAKMTMTTPKTPTVPRPQTPIKPLPQTSIRPLAQTTSGGRTSMQDPTASSERLFRGLAKILTLLESYQTTSTRLMDAYTTACRHVATQEEQVSRCHSALVHQHGIYLHVMQQTDNHKLYDLQEKAVAEAQERLEQNVKTLQMAKQHEQRLAATLRNNLVRRLIESEACASIRR